MWTRTWWICLAAVTLGRAIAAAVTPLKGTEAYYWLWSEHLSLGYYDHPPLIAWGIRLGTELFGQTPFGVRFTTLLGVTAAAILIWELARRMAGEEAAARAGLASLAMPWMTFMAVTAFPDGIMLGFGVLALLLAWQGRWPGAGAALGLSFLAKFPAALLGAGTLAWGGRPAWTRGATVALLVVLPFLAWNALHGWPTFGFHLGTRQAQEARFLPLGPLEYAGRQAVAASPVLLAVLVGALAWARRRRDSEGAFLWLHAVPTFAVFGALSFLHHIELHWPLLGYPTALVALGLACQDSPRFRAGWRWGVGVGGALVFLMLLVGCLPGLLFRFGRAEGSSLTEPWGLQEAGPLLARRLPAGAFLLAENHGIAASLQFSSGVPVHWYSRNLHGREFLRWEDYAALGGRDGLFVDTKPLEEREDVRRMLQAGFAELGPSERLLVSWRGRPARTLWLTPCRGFRGQPPGGG